MASPILCDMYTLGIDIGGTNLRLGLVTRDCRLVGYEKHKSEALGTAAPASALADLIAEYWQRHSAKDLTKAICIGFPATIDTSGEHVLNAPNLIGFDGVNVKQILSAQLDKHVIIEKDVNNLILYDLQKNNVKADCVIACYVGTGIGNAIIINGKLLRGAHGVAGEIGHVPFGDTQNACGCGNLGCAECLVGGKQLVAIRDSLFPQTPLPTLFSNHAQSAPIAQYVDRLARLIASQINMLDPELLILGGGVIAMEDFPRHTLQKAIFSYTRKPLPHDELRILFSDNADTCGVIGAGIRAWESLSAE